MAEGVFNETPFNEAAAQAAARDAAPAGNACRPCPPRCETVFDRVVVSYLVRGGTRVMWTLLPTFTDPDPLLFQLQVGETANPDADDWEDVGLPVENVYTAHDPEQRAWGTVNVAHYRVKLTTQRGVYYSDPVSSAGTVSRRDWRLAREVFRQRSVAYRYGPGGQRGYLLKRRWTGQRCPRCTDPMTQEVRDPACPVCFGTGFTCGYYYPVGCVWATIRPRGRRTTLDSGQGRGTVDDVVVTAEMLMTELLDEGDVWVNAATDDRYYVHQVNDIAEVRGVPLVAEVELRLAPFTDVVYSIPIPDQFAEAGVEA